MSTTTFYHANKEPQLQVECRDAVNAEERQPYPVLVIGAVTIFPTPQQLQQIEKAISLYLVRQVEEQRVTLAAAPLAVVESQRCDHCRQTFIGPAGQSTADTVLCPGCVEKAMSSLQPQMTGVAVPYQA